MPNWTQNWLTIKKDAAAKYLVDGKFDFNKVIPMPEIYTKKNTGAPYGPYYAGSNADECVIIYLTDGFTRELSEPDDATMQLTIRCIKYWGLNELTDGAKKLYASCQSSEEKAAMIESGRLRVEAVKRYGAPDWYGWAYRNWGTKWNAHDTYVKDIGDETVDIEFSTAWGYPEGIVAALAQKETGWEWEFADEDYTGNYIITPDHLDPELIPGTEPKAVDYE